VHYKCPIDDDDDDDDVVVQNYYASQSTRARPERPSIRISFLTHSREMAVHMILLLNCCLNAGLSYALPQF